MNKYRTLLVLLHIALILCSVRARRVISHADMPIGMFVDLARGDLSSFMRRSSLSSATEGLADRLGLDNLLGGSEPKTGSQEPFSLSGSLASGWHSKDVVGSLKGLTQQRRYVPSYAQDSNSLVDQFEKTLVDDKEAPKPISAQSATKAEQKKKADQQKSLPSSKPQNKQNQSEREE